MKYKLLLISLSVLSSYSFADSLNTASAFFSQLLQVGNMSSGGSYMLQILAFIAAVTLLPALFILMTSFARILIVLSFLRQGFGLNGVPSNQILLGLSFVLSLVVMSPVLQEVYQNSYLPFQKEQISSEEAFAVAEQSFLSFMSKNTRESDLGLVQSLSAEGVSSSSFMVLLPAFALSELKTAFIMGFFLFLPFLLIDIICSVSLMAIGLASLTPSTLSLPLKVLLFVVIDGWALLMGSFAKGFSF